MSSVIMNQSPMLTKPTTDSLAHEVDHIVAVHIHLEGLQLELPGGIVSDLYPWIWVRDHARDAHSFSVETQQRVVDVFADQVIVPKSACVSQDHQSVEIDWGIGVISRYSLRDFLGSVIEPNMLSLPTMLWPEVNFNHTDVQINYSAQPSDSLLLELMSTVQRYGFCLVENCPADSHHTDLFLQHLGVYYNSHWGGFWEFENDMAQEDSAYGSGYIGPHNDCCYYDHSPYLQVFHCLGHDGEGGNNFLVDGFAIAQDIKQADPDVYRILTSVKVPYQCVNTDVFYWSEKPVIQTDGSGNVQQISYNNADRARMWYGSEQTEQVYDAYATFYHMANDSQRQFHFKLTPGTILIFNNWRLLHGRTAFTGLRKMCGSYHGVDSVVARYRSLTLSSMS